MGVDISDIDIIYFYGPPTSLLAYWQAVGRAGRDGREAITKVYCLRSQLKKCNTEIKDLMKSIEQGTTACIRWYVLI